VMPSRRKRTRILVQAGPELRRSLADEVRRTHPIDVVQPPTRGLVMVQLRESAKRSRFHMGEVAVTEAKVRLAGTLGLGILTGDDPQAALDLAVIDAAYNAGIPEASGWDAHLAAADEAIARYQAEHDAVLLTTKVSFDTMEVT
jgi:phosphonate C-P lyase system protein PhnG